MPLLDINESTPPKLGLPVPMVVFEHLSSPTVVQGFVYVKKKKKCRIDPTILATVRKQGSTLQWASYIYITSNKTEVLLLVGMTKHICNNAGIETEKNICLRITEGSSVSCNIACTCGTHAKKLHVSCTTEFVL